MKKLKKTLIFWIFRNMIIYKKKLKKEHIADLRKGEELIYYKSDEIAICINDLEDRFLVRKKRISNNELIEESFFKSVEKVIEFVG